jgi:hypothetical protein
MPATFLRVLGLAPIDAPEINLVRHWHNWCALVGSAGGDSGRGDRCVDQPRGDLGVGSDWAGRGRGPRQRHRSEPVGGVVKVLNNRSAQCRRQVQARIRPDLAPLDVSGFRQWSGAELAGLRYTMMALRFCHKGHRTHLVCWGHPWYRPAVDRAL